MNHAPHPFTLRAAAGLPSNAPPLSDATLVLIDVQAEYEPGGALALPDHNDAIGRIAGVLAAARTTGGQVVHIVHNGSAGGLFDPAAGGRISTAAGPAENEAIIHKQLPNAFAGTGLDQQLKEHDARHLVLVGFMTHMCISSTARAALDLGYATTVVADATASRSLPAAVAGTSVTAQNVHETALAALADRFSIITTTSELLNEQDG